MMRALAWPLWWAMVLPAIFVGGLLSWLPTGTTYFDTVQTDDFMLSAGGYAASAGVLLAAATGLEAFRGPRNATRLSLIFAALYSFLALRAALLLNHAPLGPGVHSAWEGATNAVVLPWSIALLLAGGVGWVRLIVEARSTRADTIASPTARMAA